MSQAMAKERHDFDPMNNPAIRPLDDELTDLETEVSNFKLNYLVGTDLFRDLDIDQIQEFQDRIQMRTCKAGYVFYTPGETGEVMFVLKQGSAQLYRMSAEGRKIVLAQLPPGSIFGEMSCIGQGMYDCFAEASEDSLICTMSRKDVNDMIEEFPKVAIRLLETVGSRMVRAEKQLEDLAFKGLVPRLAEFILTEELEGLVSGYSHQDIGERLGVYRETATYALNELKTAGLIEIGRKKISIIDRERLIRASKES